MPFSPEFLKELSAQKGDTKSSEFDAPSQQGQAKIRKVSSTTSISSRENNAPIPTAMEGQNKLFHVSIVSDRLCLVGMQDDVGSLFVSGFCDITVLKGALSLNGYSMTTAAEEALTAQIRCPIWQPAYPIFGIRNDVSVRSHEYKTPVKSGGYSMQLASAFLQNYGICCSNQSSQKGSSNKLGGITGLFDDFAILFAIETVPSAEQEWLVAAEDQSAFSSSSTAVPVPKESYFDCIKVPTVPTLKFQEVSVVRLESAMLGNYSAMTQHRAECMTLPVSWVSASNTVLGTYNSGTRVKSVLCGAKGVGKSTCLRYLVNRLLSASDVAHQAAKVSNRRISMSNTADSDIAQSNIKEYANAPAVCVIDCDFGQPELSVPGSVALHIVTNTEQATGRHVGGILSAQHLNLQEPDTSYFLGDITSKHEPQLVLEYVRLLLQRYQQIVSEVSALQERSRKTATKKFVQSNAFNALMLDGSDESDASSEDKSARGANKQNTAGTSAAKIPPIPLVVNLDGYVKNMGAEILESILTMLEPSHTLHICSDRDRNMLPLEAILGLESASTAETSNDAAGSGSAQAPIVGNSKNNTTANAPTTAEKPGKPHASYPSSTGATASATSATSTSSSAGSGSGSSKCYLLVLEPGRHYTSPRVAAVDLRSLRLVAYFLRQDASLRGCVRRSGSASASGSTSGNASGGGSSSLTSGIGSGTSMTSSHSRSSDKLSGAEGATGVGGMATNNNSNSEGICIRNGALIDPQGSLALRLLAQPPYAVPFSHLSLGTIPTAGDLPARLMLAAVNASLVGIVAFEDLPPSATSASVSAGVNVSAGASGELSEGSINLCEMHHRSKKSFRLGGVEFQLSCLDQYPVARCIGVGIIRVVDIPNQRIILCTPVDGALLTAPQTKLCLLKGNNLSLPAMLTYSPLLPTFPYMSSESSGEGSAQLRTRNNVKRRAQHQG